jgi:hypothetical protein
VVFTRGVECSVTAWTNSDDVGVPINGCRIASTAKNTVCQQGVAQVIVFNAKEDVLEGATDRGGAALTMRHP